MTAHLPDLFAMLRKKGLPNLWIPDGRDCHVVESFPELSTGKLDLKRIGEWARAVAAGGAIPS